MNSSSQSHFSTSATNTAASPLKKKVTISPLSIRRAVKMNDESYGSHMSSSSHNKSIRRRQNLNKLKSTFKSLTARDYAKQMKYAGMNDSSTSHSTAVASPPSSPVPHMRRSVLERQQLREGSIPDEIKLTQKRVEELAQALQLSVDIRDRKCSKTQKKCHGVFVGSEAVTILEHLGKFPTRQAALNVGRLIQTNLELFQCVNAPKVKQLVDSPLLFYQFTTSMASHRNSAPINANWDEYMRTFQRSVIVKDRRKRRRARTHKQVFVGQEAVDMMMAQGMAPTREACVQLARHFQTHYNLFVPVQLGVHTFEDDPNKFYRLVLPQEQHQLKRPSVWDEIKPARIYILLSLIPALIIYYYFY